MAPRRNTNSTSSHGSAVGEHFTLADLDDLSPTSSSNNLAGTVDCCVPNGECLQSMTTICLDDLSDCVRVICNNENCTSGQYMHRECFELWEQGVLNSIKSVGRARSWSDRQRAQNLWTKKGYDLVFKSCPCKCNRGHLRKDLDWTAPTSPTNSLHLSNNNNNNNNIFMNGGKMNDDDASKKKKKRNRQNQKPTLALTPLNPGAYHPNSQNNQMNGNHGHQNGDLLRQRASSLSSSSGSTSPPVLSSVDDNSSNSSISPTHHNNNSSNQINLNGSHLSPTEAKKLHQQQIQIALQMLTPQQQLQLVQQQKNKEVEIYSERVRSTSGCNGIFSRRLDFSSFNLLPKTRLNSYQVKIEDEGNHGNDETRLFILSSLAQNQKSRVACILCEEPMFVFDRYPLVDGTFFLSPKQHSTGCIEVKYDGRNQFLTAVCMTCLDGKIANHAIYCRYCGDKWNGASLVLGTMYSYDIFAAMPCCAERLKCNNCFKLIIHPQQRLNFYSDYSHAVTCPYCTTQDTHFVKALRYCYTKRVAPKIQQLP